MNQPVLQRMITVICHGLMRKHAATSQRFANATLYTIDTETGVSLRSLWPHICKLLSMGRKTGKTRVTQPLRVNGTSPLFIKTSTLDSIPSRVRATLGLKRRSGLYDWALEELCNHAEAQTRTDLIPKLFGYGVIRQRGGLVNEIFLNYENLAGWMDGYEWLRKNPSNVCRFAEAGLALIAQLNAKGIYHLDLWAGNMMLSDGDLENLKAIDLENCFIGENRYTSETLGFQFAFLYQHQLNEFITETIYDQIVESQLAGWKAIQKDRFDLFYKHFKHHGADRKERHLIPKTGHLMQLNADGRAG
ncbi:BUD32 family EKC/KEOPS complex subunit [Ectopseudomonas composti]|nr:hypothetical protein [Pseudomonas composti]